MLTLSGKATNSLNQETEMSPEMISIIGVGVVLLMAWSAISGVIIALMLRLGRRIDRAGRKE